MPIGLSLGRRDDGAVRPVHPDARDLRAPSAAASTRRPGTQNLDGNEPSPDLITSRQVLEWATLGGAKVAGIADRTGSITPGKKADVVIIDGSAVNVAPIIDPVGAVVCAADVSNVKTVLVDGEILKDDFKLAGVARRARARRSRPRATTSSRSSASRSPAGCPERNESGHSAVKKRVILRSGRSPAPDPGVPDLHGRERLHDRDRRAALSNGAAPGDLDRSVQ